MPPGTGQFIIAIDPALTGGMDMSAHFAALAGQITGQDGARLPGSRRIALREKSAREGIKVAQALVSEIEAL